MAIVDGIAWMAVGFICCAAIYETRRPRHETLRYTVRHLRARIAVLEGALRERSQTIRALRLEEAFQWRDWDEVERLHDELEHSEGADQ